MSIKIKLAAIAKDEGAYLPQWIYHHFAFGFDEIEIWLNNTTDVSEPMLTALIEHYGADVIKFRNADSFLKQCLEEDLPFQQRVYSKIYFETVLESTCSHIIFLDLDEFWVPKNFRSSIKDYIGESASFDALSFQWVIDSPDHFKNVFSPPFSNINIVQKNRHLKTLVKVTTRMEELSIHNHSIYEGLYLLDNKIVFSEDDAEETQNKSLAPIDFFEENKSSLNDDAFIFHQINRSSVEYLSSLLRGRGHKNDNNVFKVNRTGYLPDVDSGPSVLFKIDAARLEKYDSGFEKFLHDTGIRSLLTEAKRFIFARFYNAVSLIRSNPDLLPMYRMQLKGVKINDLISEPLKTESIFLSVDAVSLVDQNHSLNIEGWLFDTLSYVKPDTSAFLSSSLDLCITVNYLKRPDVLELYPDADIDAGFFITITKRTSEPFYARDQIRLIFSSDSSKRETIINLADLSISIENYNLTV
ncbi:glycosyltransferase family 2 protein [Pseudomonas syringae]|uniref:glycosyltransferase family 2 protein n=1 Tax=Pseudomonas syringae TaxID=317 RepID=UPI00215A5A58|nr:glycosyltransferase family 2 protein [Pseudomonas syringae]MCR8722003.1 glycosyltransferase family 2 protein [Pseudomonas syringae]